MPRLTAAGSLPPRDQRREMLAIYACLRSTAEVSSSNESTAKERPLGRTNHLAELRMISHRPCRLLHRWREPANQEALTKRHARTDGRLNAVPTGTTTGRGLGSTTTFGNLVPSTNRWEKQAPQQC
eukprot:1189484-Prorocentrum_minimum.AAC.3